MNVELKNKYAVIIASTAGMGIVLSMLVGLFYRTTQAESALYATFGITLGTLCTTLLFMRKYRTLPVWRKALAAGAGVIAFLLFFFLIELFSGTLPGNLLAESFVGYLVSYMALGILLAAILSSPKQLYQRIAVGMAVSPLVYAACALPLF